MKIYFYKVMYDNGGAPAISDGLLSLAICKPRIRSTCEEGDLIFGFGSNTMNKRHHLIYVAQITKTMPGCAYYDSQEHRTRRDCIYEKAPDSFSYQWKSNSKHHRDRIHIKTDLGDAPDYKNANVLLSTEFRYFGRDSKPFYEFESGENQFNELKSELDNLRQGHRVNHAKEISAQLFQVRNLAFAQAPTEFPQPTDSNLDRSCSRIEDDCYAWVEEECSEIVNC